MSRNAKSLSQANLVLLGALAVSGCSSIIEGRSQEIVINTNPSGATCSLIRNNMPIGTVTPTPNAILIEKTKYDIVVKCNLAGYQEATYFNKSGSAGATFGNIILGGGIGWAIDSASGADNKYDSPLNITLVPIVSGIASVAPATPVATPAVYVPTATNSTAPATPSPTTSAPPTPTAPAQTKEPSNKSNYPTSKR
jgi:hypothetical protein